MMNNPHAPQLPMTACYAPLSHGSLFSGIGGFDLAAEWVGWLNRFHCEWNEFGQRILKHYWPNAESYGDITKTDFTIWRGRIDVLTGGFPCQPYSLAGKRLGKEDERHLWPEMLRAIREISPRYIVGENVVGLLSWNGGLVFDEVQTDLEAAGYEIQPVILPACAVNAPHKRERVWFVAYNSNARIKSMQQQRENGVCEIGTITNTNGTPTRNEVQTRRHMFTGDVFTNAASKGREEWEQINGLEDSTKVGTRLEFRDERFSDNGDASNAGCRERQNGLHGQEPRRQAAEFGNSYTKFGAWSKFPITEPTICGGNDGISSELDGITFPKWRNESIKAFGNAIVPQVAFQIFKAIQLHDASLSGA